MMTQIYSHIIIASGPVIIENNTVLLNMHGDTDFWKFCGGRVDDYSISLAESARRKVEEEMGLDVEIMNENPFILYTKKSSPDGDSDVILVHFLAKRINEISPHPDIREWKWHNITNLPKNLAPNIIPTLKHFGFIK